MTTPIHMIITGSMKAVTCLIVESSSSWLNWAIRSMTLLSWPDRSPAAIIEETLGGMNEQAKVASLICWPFRTPSSMESHSWA